MAEFRRSLCIHSWSFALGDRRTASVTKLDPAFFGQSSISFGNGIEVDAQVDCHSANRRQLRTRSKLSAHQQNS